MQKLNKGYIAPILIIAIGVGWLLTVQGILPTVDWSWTFALAAAGVLTLAVGGIDRLTIVAGPFLIGASVCSLLRQTGKLTLEQEIPILTIALGVLMLIAHMAKLPKARIVNDKEGE